EICGDHDLPRLRLVLLVVDALEKLPAFRNVAAPVLVARATDVDGRVPTEAVDAVLLEPHLRVVGDVVANLGTAEVDARAEAGVTAPIRIEEDAAEAVARSVEAPERAPELRPVMVVHDVDDAAHA